MRGEMDDRNPGTVSCSQMNIVAMTIWKSLTSLGKHLEGECRLPSLGLLFEEKRYDRFIDF